MNQSGESKFKLYNISNFLGLDSMSGVAAILRYPLPGLDDIEEQDIDIDELINQEEERKEEDDEEEKRSDKSSKK